MSSATNKLSVRVDDNQISFYSPNDPEDNVIITFHRTLRIPDDGKIYPLPPSLGNFPIKRVDDYLDRVPEKWKKTGGVFIPLYQREAMWMEFLNVSSEHPHALKVAVGKVNALSGEMWDEEMKDRNVQDYVTTPLQPWLDGINSGDGTIKQFIAMPLGQGYTVESQVTGEDKVGGAQIVCYNPVDQKRRRQFAKEPVRQPPPPQQQPVIPQPYYDFPQNPFLPQIPIMPPMMNQPMMSQPSGFTLSSSSYSPVPTSTTTTTTTASVQPSMVMPMSKSSSNSSYSPMPQCESTAFNSLDTTSEEMCCDDCEYEPSFAPPPSVYASAYSSSIPQSFGKSEVSSSRDSSTSSISRKKSVPPQNLERSREEKEKQSSKAQELGLASGGKMKQQIIEDPYGFEFWDVSTKARVFIHIVNSEMFAQITGESVPPTPISAQTYASYNYPWFDHYTENVGSVGKSDILSGIKSVKEIDEQKYAWSQQDDSSVKINNVVTHKETFNKNDVRDGEW